jgi:hypothetical protein
MAAVCGAQAHTVSVVGCCRAAAMADEPVPAAAGVLLALAAALAAALDEALLVVEAAGLAELLELLQAARPVTTARPAAAADAVAPAVRQPRALVLLRGFSCIVVPSTSVSTVRRLFEG